MSNQWDFISARFRTSAVKTAQYPEDNLPEIAFIGRSNVGKSTLINSLTRRKGLARVSSTPGKTQTINFYEIDAKRGEPLTRSKLFFVDLPGYGFARTAQHSKEQWSAFIGKYLEDSQPLRVVCQLIDIRHKPMENDLACYKWLQECGRKIIVVLTKADKVSKSVALAQKDLFKKELGLTESSIVIYSVNQPIMRADLINRLMEEIC